MKMVIELIEIPSAEDKTQILNILARSFPLEYSAGLEHFNFFIEKCPNKIYLVARNQDSQIIAVSCILRRKFNYEGLVLNLAGLSYSAVIHGLRDFTVTNKLWESLFEYLSVNSDLSLGFARKVLDNYWYPHGFLGFTNFGSISIEVPDYQLSNLRLRMSALKRNEIRYLLPLFHETYEKNLNTMLRSIEDWEYILDKLGRNQQYIFSIKDSDNAIVGYLLRSSNIVEEICVDEQYMGQVLTLICSTARKEDKSVQKLYFNIGLKHPFSIYLRKRMHHSINTRFAWKGGHIIRVSNLQKFFNQITGLIQSRLSIIGSSNFFIEFLGVSFRFESAKLVISVSQLEGNKRNVQQIFWQKLIFGVQDAEDCIVEPVVDAETLILIKLMFPIRNPQISILDQF